MPACTGKESRVGREAVHCSTVLCCAVEYCTVNNLPVRAAGKKKKKTNQLLKGKEELPLQRTTEEAKRK